MNLKGRSFLKLLDFTPAEITYLLGLAAELKAKKKAGIPHRIREGKNIALLFEKDSTRTRCAFEVAGHDLGMGVTYLGPTGSQMGKKEIHRRHRPGAGPDVRRHRVPGLSARPSWRSWPSLPACPVWNGLTNEFHPTQILADFLTIQEHFGGLQGKKLVYMGDARYNMGDSLMVGCAKMGMHFVACAPEKYFPDPGADRHSVRPLPPRPARCWNSISDPDKAVQGADVIYTDVWVSMGEPDERLAGADRRPGSLSGDKAN